MGPETKEEKTTTVYFRTPAGRDWLCNDQVLNAAFSECKHGQYDKFRRVFLLHIMYEQEALQDADCFTADDMKHNLSTDAAKAELNLDEDELAQCPYLVENMPLVLEELADQGLLDRCLLEAQL
jgi:hypothetical protein